MRPESIGFEAELSSDSLKAPGSRLDSYDLKSEQDLVFFAVVPVIGRYTPGRAAASGWKKLS